jgi:large subunit ribosomal protein L29
MADSVTATELRKLSAKQLAERLDDAKAELFNLRFQLATNQLDNTARLTHVKKDVARILTVMRQQEIEAWEASVAGGHGETEVGRRKMEADPREASKAAAVEIEAPTAELVDEVPVAEPVEKKRRLRRGR